MSESYLTIDADLGGGVEVELEIKRSRFLTTLRRVEDEASARAIIDENRSRYHAARHHCSAFVLGPDGRTARSSDDGEPAGTAGIPMLGVLTSNALRDVVAVVTRYFGGIKLGAGGLVRAYSDAVAQAITTVGTRRVELRALLTIEVPLATIGPIEAALRDLRLPSGPSVVVEGIDWGETAVVTVAIPVAARDEFDAALASLSAGALTASVVGQRWVDVR